MESVNRACCSPPHNDDSAAALLAGAGTGTTYKRIQVKRPPAPQVATAANGLDVQRGRVMPVVIIGSRLSAIDAPKTAHRAQPAALNGLSHLLVRTILDGFCRRDATDARLGQVVLAAFAATNKASPSQAASCGINAASTRSFRSLSTSIWNWYAAGIDPFHEETVGWVMPSAFASAT